MTQLDLAGSLYDALTLAERTALLHASSQNEDPLGAERVFDAGLAERRLKRWRSQAPFGSDIYFAQRLAVDHLSPEDFEWLLGESSEQLSKRLTEMPEWLKEIQ